MLIAIDTNVLVYATNSDAPENEPCHRLVRAVAEGRLAATGFPQMLLEFYAVVTNRRRFAQPLTSDQARKQMGAFRRAIPVLGFLPEALTQLDRLLRTSEKIGGDVFDAAIAAQMKAHHLEVICTYNLRDFAGYQEIKASLPETILEALG